MKSSNRASPASSSTLSKKPSRRPAGWTRSIGAPAATRSNGDSRPAAWPKNTSRPTPARLKNVRRAPHSRTCGNRRTLSMREDSRALSGPMQEILQLEDEFTIAADTQRTISPPRVLKHGDTFSVFDQHGDVVAAEGGEHGLYHHGT